MQPVLSALLVFVLRITDVSLGTLRVLYTVRGRRMIAASLGVVEAGVFIVAISRVFKHVDNPLSMAGYALGFAAGTILGMTLEQWIASGTILVRIISREKWAALLEGLRQAGFGVTAIQGEGRQGAVSVLMVVAARKRGKEVLRITQEIDPAAFVTMDAVVPAMGGFLPHMTPPAGVKK